MDNREIGNARKRLLELRAELEGLAGTGRSASAVVELDQSRVGRLSRVDAMQAQAMSQESDRRREVMQERIDAALARIDQDDYGLCVRCGEQIAAGRLEFDPTVMLCIECAQKSEE